MAKSIAETSVKLTANAQQFVQEFKRADNESRRASAAIDKEAARISRTLERKFSLADTGMEFLRGAGLGSGFGVIATASSKIMEVINHQAEVAKDIEETMKAIIASSKEYERSVMSPADRLADMKKEFGELQQHYIKIAQPQFRDATATEFAMSQGKITKVGIPHTSDDELAIARNVQAQEKIAEEIDRLQREIGKDGMAASEKSSAARAAVIAEIQKEADKYRDLIDPMRKFNEAMDEVENLFEAGALSGKEADKADAIIRARQDAFANPGQKPGTPLTDRFTRVGLMTGLGADMPAHAQKQINVLEKIDRHIVELHGKLPQQHNVGSFNII